MQSFAQHLLYAVLFSAFCAPLLAPAQPTAHSQAGGQDGADSNANVAASADEVCPLKISATIPKLSLTSVDGERVDLNAEIAKKPTILIF